MITIYAEKPDVGKKIAAALDRITLSNGRVIDFDSLKNNDGTIKAQQHRDGYLKISFKGEEAYVTWGYGHLCELQRETDYDADYKKWSNLPKPFIPDEYRVKIKEGAKKQFDIVKGLFFKSRLIINATDYDREGELIFHYVMQAANCKKPFKRAHFSSQTKEGIRDAFDSLKSAAEAKPMTDAGRGRSIADWVIGCNLTVAMTLKYGNSGVLSIGRVQTPTLNLLVERELAIRNFKSETYYTVEALFKTGKGETYKGEHAKKRFDTLAEANTVLSSVRNKQGTVQDVAKKVATKEAPLLYSLSSLQMAANAKYGFTLAKTQSIAQELYESGYTTYPRTDSQYLTEDMEPVVNRTLAMLETFPEYAPLVKGRVRKYNKKHYFDNSKVSSHFAIIPTLSKPSSLTPDQQKIYDLVARSVIMMLYGPAKIEKTTVVTNVAGEEFISSGSVILDKGWMCVDNASKEEFLPILASGDTVSGSYEIKQKKTEPPKRYTDKTLIAAMISAGKDLDDEGLRKIMSTGVKGIGTEATRAAIIEALINRGYAAREKKSVLATDKGIALIGILPLKEIKSAELTAMWEDKLNAIAEGKGDLEPFINGIEDLTRRWCDEIYGAQKVATINSPGSQTGSGTAMQCPVCGKPVLKKSWGWGCSGYKDGCKFSISGTIASKKITDKQAEALVKKRKTGVIKGFTSKAGKNFDAMLVLNDENKIVFEFPAKK